MTGAYREDGSIDITGNASANLITFDHDLTYLADKNDNFLQGWVSDENGVVTTTSTPESIRVDRFAFLSDARATSKAYLTGNIPATRDVAGTNAFKASVLDADGTSRTFELIFTKTSNAQEWTAHINSSGSVTAT